MIHGVEIIKIVTHNDERGFFREIMTKTNEIKQISIDIHKDKIVIKDNAFGMNESTTQKNFAEIGVSEKKTDFITNGEKGFGIYSFLAWCDNLSFSTKTEEEAHW